MAEGIFHLAIPCRDLDEAAQFYAEVVGARPARRKPDRVTLEFFGHQVVCHLAPEKIDPKPEVYPRHFGFTFVEEEPFDAILERVNKTPEVMFQEPFERFAGQRDEHRTFLIKDPSNNLIEFKFYRDREMMY